MKKNTFAKWMLAGAAMVVAFACQSKKSPDDSDRASTEDNSSCPCTGGHSTLVVPAAVIKVEEVASTDKDKKSDEVASTDQDKTSDEVSTYVIEIIESSEEVVKSSKNEATAVTEEAAPELVTAPSAVPATDTNTSATQALEEGKPSSTTLNTAPIQSNLDEAADATDSTIYVNSTATPTNQ